MSRTPRHPKMPPAAPIGLAGATACALAATWALCPLPGTGVPSAEAVLASIQPAAPIGGTAGTVAPFDAAAFHAPIWIAANAETAPIEPEPPLPIAAPPSRVTLLAIARDASHALVHDQDADRVLTLRQGDQVQGRTVTSVEPGRVVLTLGSGQTQTLELGYPIGAASPSPDRAAAAIPAVEHPP